MRAKVFRGRIYFHFLDDLMDMRAKKPSKGKGKGKAPKCPSVNKIMEMSVGEYAGMNICILYQNPVKWSGT